MDLVGRGIKRFQAVELKSDSYFLRWYWLDNIGKNWEFAFKDDSKVKKKGDGYEKKQGAGFLKVIWHFSL